MGVFLRVVAKPYFKESSTDLRECSGCRETIYSCMKILRIKLIYDCRVIEDQETDLVFCASCFNVLNLQV